MNNRVRAALLTLLGVVLFFTTLVGIVWIDSQINLNVGVTTQEGSTRFALRIIIFGAYFATVLFFVAIYSLVHDKLRHIKISLLYLPILLLAGCFSTYMDFLGVQSYDLLTHGLRSDRGPIFDPELRLEQNLLLVGVFAAIAILVGIILRGRIWNRARLLVLGATITGCVILMAFVITHTN